MIGGFVGGCYAGLMGCKLVAMSGLGVFALAGFLSSDIMNFVNYVIAVVILRHIQGRGLIFTG